MQGARMALGAVALCAACGRLQFTENDGPCAVQLDAGPPRINLNTHRVITATGGREPYRFTATSTQASIDETTGELAVFNQPDTVTVTATDADGCTGDAALTIGGDTLWYVGGSSNAVPSAQVWRSTDTTTWTLAGMLPDKRMFGALVAFRDRLWWISGSDGVTVRDEIFVSDDGATWTLAGHVPTAASSFGFTVFQDQLWFVGGNNNAGRVYRSDDALTWTLVGSLPMDNHGGALAPVGNTLVYAGGHNGNLFDWILSSPDGATWTQIGTMALPREYASPIVVGNRFFVAGGQDTTPTTIADVTSTTDGSTWSSTPSFPAGRAFGTLVRWNDQLWSMGGTDGGGIWNAAPGGTWTPVSSSFPIPRQGGGAAVFTPP